MLGSEFPQLSRDSWGAREVKSWGAAGVSGCKQIQSRSWLPTPERRGWLKPHTDFGCLALGQRKCRGLIVFFQGRLRNYGTFYCPCQEVFWTLWRICWVISFNTLNTEKLFSKLHEFVFSKLFYFFFSVMLMLHRVEHQGSLIISN